MSKWDKRIDRWRQNPLSVRFDEVDTVLQEVGFVRRRSGGSHVTYSYPGRRPITISVHDNKLVPRAVRDVLLALKDVLEE